ncbi:MAG: hypothetical protein PVH10_03275 [Methyloceanibacter sp.]
MKSCTAFALTLMMAVSVSLGAMADEKKCKEGHVYSETEEKCIPKPGPARPDKS